jgi:hypothetical protein
VVNGAWRSGEAEAAGKALACLTRAPEIRVEVIPPSDARSAIEERRPLHGEAEAWE